MQPNALSRRLRGQADSLRGHIKVSVIATLVMTLVVGSVATANAWQPQEIPKFKPSKSQKDKPVKQADPFENYESTPAESPTKTDTDAGADPFENYEGQAAAADTKPAASDPFTNYEDDAETTVSKKPVSPPQKFDGNDLRSTAPKQVAPSNQYSAKPQRQALPPIRSTLPPKQTTAPSNAGSLPPMQLARPAQPNQIRSLAPKPPVQAAPLARAKQQNVLPLTRAPKQPIVQRSFEPKSNNGATVNRLNNGNVIVDPNLAPATFNEPIPPAKQFTATVKPSVPMVESPKQAPLNIPKNPNVKVAKTLLNELRASEHSMPTVGEPLALVDALAKVSQTNRKFVVQQYWKTYGAWAEYRFAIDEMQWLRQVNQPQSQADRALLAAAQSAAKDSVDAKHILLEREQRRLNRYVNGKESKGMPLPSDNPLVFRYRTQFDLYSTKRTMPEELRVLNVRLPKRYQLIGNRSATVQRCRTAVMQASREVGTSQPAATLLQAMMMSREAHSSFVQTVVWYNQDVTEYALAVKPYENSAENVVSMLIPKKRAPGSADTGMRQAQLPNNSLNGTSRRPVAPMNSSPLTNQPTNTPRSFNNGSRTNDSFGGSPSSRPGTSGSSLPPRRSTVNPAINPNGFNGRSALPPSRGTQGSSALPPARSTSPPSRGFRR